MNLCVVNCVFFNFCWNFVYVIVYMMFCFCELEFGLCGVGVDGWCFCCVDVVLGYIFIWLRKVFLLFL